jgi:hypothetical protein
MTYPNYTQIKADYFKEVPELELPIKSYQYRAYKNGECQIFETKADAEKYSKLTEKFQIDEEVYNDLLKQYHEQGKAICAIWDNQVREYFNHYSDDEFQIIYDFGYEQGHSDGYNSVFDYMVDAAEIVEKINKLHGR